jgi:small subunit ribosomal protein S17
VDDMSETNANEQKTATKAAPARGKRKVVQGIVRSSKMKKTIAVETEYLQKHPKYGKYVKKFTRYYAHDEKNEAKEGDLVEICETRPLSKLKRFRLVKVVRRAAQV